ncbi:MAG TPA: transcriptional regulator [Eubacteriaceae bacterium]|nr:transcriptional regulator [Eubacteriaceae bacterium]
MKDDFIKDIHKMKQVSELLKVLANENRLIIICYLLESPLTVGELTERLDNLTQSAISQHLSILRSHQILDSEKKGQTITYFVKDQRIRIILESIRENYC